MLTMKTIDENTDQSAMYDLMKIIILVAMNPYSWKLLVDYQEEKKSIDILIRSGLS